MAPEPQYKKFTVIKKKRTKKFGRFQSDAFMRVGASYRRPQGIDNPILKGKKSQRKMVKVGYKNDKRQRFVLPNGFKKFRVSNPKDIEMLLMHNQRYCVEIAGSVGTRKRTQIIERAKALNLVVLNGDAQFETEEQE